MYPDTLHLTWHQVDRDSDPLVVVVNPIPATDSVAKDILWVFEVTLLLVLKCHKTTVPLVFAKRTLTQSIKKTKT